jgi:hypothetical protein
MKKNLLVLTIGGFALLLVLTSLASASSVNCSGVTAWVAGGNYTVNELVTYQGSEYKCVQANNNAASNWDPIDWPGAWTLVGACTSGGTATATATKTATATATKTATATATKTATATATKTATATATKTATATATKTATATATKTATPTGGKMFAPYIDMSSALAESLTSVSSASGIKWFTGAFVVGSGCTPEWGGLNATLTADNMWNGQSILSNVQALQTAGGNIIISNGGQTGPELADSCLNVSSTQAGYQAEITRYGTKYIDFDIETGVAGIDVRSQAIAGLAAANSGLVASLTLPGLPTGLLSTGVTILNSAKSHGAPIATVNIMAMDYGSMNDNGAQMGLDAEDAAAAVYNQVKTAGLSAGIGITPMIGVNDTTTEIFQLSDASSLVSWANSNSYVNRVSYWSVGRDNGSCAGSTSYASSTCSGLTQSSYQFAGIFKAF